jgi:hypothetical protein
VSPIRISGQSYDVQPLLVSLAANDDHRNAHSQST